MNTNWQNMCFKLNHKAFKNEAEIEESFGDIFDMVFGWHGFEGKLKHQVSVPVGHETKKADIVLYYQRRAFVIEMKGPGIIPHQPEILQLKSYMKILGSEYGLIANNKTMWLYYSAFQSPRIEEFACIPYESENTDGNEFASIMKYSDFSFSKLDDFRKKKHQEELDKKNSKELSDALCSEDGKMIILKALLSCEELRTKYSEEAINMAVKEIEIKHNSKAIEIPVKKDGTEIKNIEVFCSRRGSDAHGVFINEKKFIVKAGSRVSTNGPSGSCPVPARRKYDELMQVSINGILKEDMEFTSASAASSFVALSSSNGYEDWVDKNGTKLGVITGKH